MARPVWFLLAGAALLIAAAVPAFFLKLTPGSTFGIPRTPQSVQGFDVLQGAVGPGAVAPSIVLVGAKDGTVVTPPVQAAIARLDSELRRDPEVAAVYHGTGGRFVDSSRRYQQVIVAGRHDYRFPEAQAFVKRLRHELIPGARFRRASTSWPAAARRRESTSSTAPTRSFRR